MKLFLLRTVIFLLLFSSTAHYVQAQAIGAGDLLFTGINIYDDDYNGSSQNDAFSFILLRNCPSNTVIYFTDLGWTGSGFQSLSCSAGNGSQTDGVIRWTSGSSVMRAGQQVVISCKYSPTATRGTVTPVAATVATASLSSKEYISLGLAGDQLFAFTGSLAAPTIIGGINVNRKTWETSLDACDFSSSSSVKPATTTVLDFPSINAVNARYNCSTLVGSFNTLRNKIRDTTLWNKDYTLSAPAPSTFDLKNSAPCDIAVAAPDANGILYVNNLSAISGDGTSWAQPIQELRDALSAAAITGSNISKIWVAKGTYKPAISGSQATSFSIPSYVAVYGGFAGSETTLAARDIPANPVILSGDIDNNDVLTGGIVLRASNINGNNSYHVVTSAGVLGLLDGVTITGGSATNPSIAAFKFGGGVYSSSGDITITNTRFYGNRAGVAAGALYNVGANMQLSNCVFFGNQSGYQAGAIEGAGGNLTLTNVTISGNNTPNGGAGLAVSLGNFAAYNTIISGNTSANSQGDTYFYSPGTEDMYYTILGDQYYINTYTQQPTPAVTFTDFANGDLRLTTANFAINRGDPLTNTFNYAVQAGTLDLAGQSRISNTVIDLGAYEFQALPQTITFPAFSTVTYGDENIDPQASTSGDGPITYTSGNTAVAQVVNGKIKTTGAGTAVITARAAATNTYLPAIKTQTITVNKKGLLVKADDASRPYGTPNPAATFTYSGFVYGDNASVITGTVGAVYGATQTSNAGTYPITPDVSGAAAANYQLSGSDGTLTITQTSQTITFTPPSNVTYGDAPVTLPLNSDAGLPIVYNIVSGPAGVSGNTLTITGAGDVTITADQAGDVNHTAAIQVSQTFTVAKAVLTVTANDKTRLYNQANPVLDYTITGFVNGDNNSVVSGVADVSTTADLSSPVGTYQLITGAGTLIAANYSFTTVNGTLTVTQSAQTITFPAIADKTYGVAPFALNATSSSGLPITYTVTSGPATISGNMVTLTSGGDVEITATQSGDANYTAAAPVANTFRVFKRNLLLRIDNQQRPYGTNNPALTYTYDAFVNGDDYTAILETPQLSTTASAGSAPGNYPITVSNLGDLVSYKYNVIPVNGTLTVSVAPQTISFPSITDKTYGDAAFALGASSNSGLAVSYSVVSGPAAISGNTLTITGVGTVTIAANQAGDANYLAASQTTQAFNVGKAVLTVTANNKTKSYLQANPALDYTITSFVNSDNNSVVSGAGDISTTAGTNSPVGTYPITVATGSLNAANYSFGFVNGTLSITQAAQTISFPAIANKTYGDAAFTLSATSSSGLAVTYTVTSGPATISGNTLTITGAGSITVTAEQAGDANYSAALAVSNTFQVAPATLTVQADDQQKVYGANNPVLTYTITGFVNGDNSSVVSGAPVLSTTADASSATGIYPVTITTGTLSAANYTFTTADGTLTVGQAAQTITFPAIAGKTYGDAAFTLSATASSSLAVSYSVVSGPATISGGTVTITGAGTVMIAANQAGNASYLAAAQATQTFSISKAVLTVTANNKTKSYLQANPALDYTITGFVNSDNNSVVSGTGDINTTAGTNSPVGTYPITVAAGSLNAANYSFSFVNGTLTVSQASQTISFPAITGKTYGDAAFALNASSSSGLALSYTITSGPAVVNGNTLTITGAGSITVTAAQAGDANYSAAPAVSQTFQVAPATLTVQADDKQKVYGANNPPLTYTITGFVNGDNNSVISGAPVLSTSANTGSATGTYPITVAAGTLSAANYTFTNVNGTLTIGLTTQTISFPAIAAKIYGDAAFALNASSSSGLPPSYSVVSGPATINGNTVTITGAGTITVAAGQAGNASYSAAAQATQTFTVSKAALTITAANDTRVYNGTAYTGGNGVTYAGFVNGDDAAKLAGSLTYAGTSQGAVNAGAYNITPAGLTSNNYNITYTDGQLSISKAAQQIVFTAAGNKNQGDPDFTLSATASSGLPVTFASSNTQVISLNGNTAHVGIAGSAIITASQAGNSNYEPAQPVTQTIQVNTWSAPVITAQGSTTFCAGNTLTLQSSTAPAYEWYRDGILVPGANGRSLTVNESGSYTVKAIYALNTGIASAAVNVTVNPLPAGDIQVTGNTTISKGETVRLTASGGSTYVWTPAAGLNDPAIAAPVARPAATVTYQVTISSNAGCSVTKEITITVKEDFKLEATNILTPNGDGKNDLWVVKNIDMYPQNEVKIFDRSGRMVYHQQGYLNTWNGKVNGQPLAEGTYYYIVDLGDNKPVFKGFITIILDK